MTTDSHGDGASDTSDDTQWLDEAISHSLTGSDGTNLKDFFTKRRLQMGLLDAEHTSDDSLVKFWDNNGDIASWSYADQVGPKWGVTFLTPNTEKLSHDQFVVVHKHADALQDELGHSNDELSKHLKNCEHVTDELCNKLTVGFQNMDTKFAELYTDIVFVQDLQQNVKSIQKDLDEFRNVYTLFHENSFTPLLGNVDANNICLNELSKDVSSVQENVWSISQKVHKMSQAVYSIEKNMDVRCSKELTQLRGDFISLHSSVGIY